MQTVGILTLQGDYDKHAQVLRKRNVDTRSVRYPDDLLNCDALIIPGGESTTMSKLMDHIGIRDEILTFAQTHPVMGTCAGMILMANRGGDSRVKPLGLLDITIVRNAYGRQVDSFVEEIEFKTQFGVEVIKGVFIRAPKIKSIGGNVEVLAELYNEPVFVRQGLHMATSFHPELSNSCAIHDLLISMIWEPVLAE
ncbi:MAG: pyridoxal 5'-phosphate synthase glutaminase subunit PdxT [Candidatus Marinimicrobia bacterium]|nr:pyridoxal 5'-phosphate synthase glutaminase subunit PdxT [Candidatus Neomarinimicrobiota bacterium]MCH8067668.1 pyridoxal 5'-phosphate synthase glutaminase subunit PdxT [Candidatus Neomarinimicrobiota bacterium]